MDDRVAVLDERWPRIWAAMRAAGYSCLIVAGRGTIGEYGWLQFVTGIYATTRVWYAIVHLDHPPLLVLRSSAEADAVEKESWASIPRRIAGRNGVEYAAEVGGIARARATGRIGVVGSESIGRPSWCRLAEALGEVPEDAEELLRPIRAAKSERDFDGLRRAAAIAESGLNHALENLRTGMSERRLASDIEAVVRGAGAQLTLVHVSRGAFSASRPTREKIAADDVVTVLVELSTGMGYWVEIGMAIAMPDAHRTVPLASRCVAALAQGEAALRSGGDVGSVADSMLRALGADTAPAIGLGHGVGIDEEPPVVVAGSREAVAQPAAFALHPSGNEGSVGAGCAVANTFLVTEGEVEAVSALPMELQFVDS